MKCEKCGYSDNGTGDWAHVCGPVKVKHYSNTNNPIDFPKSDGMKERIEQGKEPSIENVKKHMKETNNESFYQVREQMRNEEYGTLPPGYSSWGMYWKSR